MEVRCNVAGDLQFHTLSLQDGRQVSKIRLENLPQGVSNAEITAEWSFPILDIAGRWHPTCRFDRSLRADWSYGEKSMSAVSAPIIAFYSEDGKNRGTFAVSEALKEVRMNLGVHEEDGTMKCVVTISTGNLTEDHYEVSILSDYRDVEYEKSIRGVAKWWEEDCGFTPAYVPKEAKDPMYSFWYSYHQSFTDEEVEAECKRAADMGFKTVIVDDGWQTDDENRGYAFCGDWEPTPKKIRNMKQHVDQVHSMGLKYLLWFSVPYVGIHSEMWKKCHDKVITVDNEQKAGVLDIRYPEVRNYLKNIYISAVKDWGLDGLKLDFIDEFHERTDTPKPNDAMDCACLQVALDKLLQETMEELKKINPEILIEFRQRYVGPAIRQYGNMLRVGDCPESGISNRVASVDLRLLSGCTAVHSDPILWHRDEKPEIAALQIVDSLFTTMQFSVRLDQMSEEQKVMVQNYMAFMRTYCSLLQDGEIEAKEPHNLYPEVRVKDEKTEIIVVYSADRVVKINPKSRKTILVNGTKAEEIYVLLEEECEKEISQIDCFGHEVASKKRTLSGIQKLNCTVAGRIEIL